jgi:hypothetical protein
MNEAAKKGASDKRGGYGKQQSEMIGAKQGQMLKSGADDDITKDKFLMGSYSSSSKGGK